MGDHTPWFMVHPREEVPTTNEGMVQGLVRSPGALRSPACIAAFQAIDRQHFWPAEGANFAYHDMPLRSGRLHLSAPHIYAKALESLLPLKPGMSFLNVGSGTGYFNSIVSELIGALATNHGIDIWPDTVAHAERCCRALGKTNIEFTVGNVYQLDVNWTMRYDRIYLGACAKPRSKYLYRLLEVGGILIGPFQVGHAQQQLRRVVRISETQFNVEVLGAVQFASLIEPPVPTAAAPQPSPAYSPPSRRGSTFSRRRTSSATEASAPGGDAVAGSVFGGAASRAGPLRADGQIENSPALGLPGVPFSFSLWERPWTPERCWLYPASYRRTVAMSLLSRARDVSLPCLPTEIWVKHIFPWCPKGWFEPLPQATPSMTPRKAPQLSDGMPSPMVLTPAYKPEGDRDEEHQHSDDDDVSTRTPSTSLLSGDVEAGMAQAAEEDATGMLFEVFGNGERHAIGTADDPDDVEPDMGLRMVVPFEVFQALTIASDARRRRHREVFEQLVARRRRRREEREDDDPFRGLAGRDERAQDSDDEHREEEAEEDNDGDDEDEAPPRRVAEGEDEEEAAATEEPMPDAGNGHEDEDMPGPDDEPGAATDDDLEANHMVF